MPHLESYFHRIHPLSPWAGTAREERESTQLGMEILKPVIEQISTARYLHTAKEKDAACRPIASSLQDSIEEQRQPVNRQPC